MNSKKLKIYYIVAGSFAGLAILYYIVRIIDRLVNENDITGTLLDKLNIVALIFLGIALLMLIGGIFISSTHEKKQEKIATSREKDQELLAKYKSRKNKEEK